jgi:outer membrane protein TolC
VLFRRVLAFVVASLSITTAAHADEPLTLDAALHLAFTRNERALKAPLRVEAAEGSLDRARTAFLPTLVGQGVGAWSSISDAKSGRNLSGNASLTVNQPILAPSAFPLYDQAKHNLRAERWGAVEDLRILGFDTTSAFITALTAETLLTAAERRLERAKGDRDDAAARAGAGLASSNDVTRGSVAVSTAESQVVTARGNVQRAYLQLAYLVGQPVSGPLVSPDRTTQGAKQGQWNFDDVVKRAQERRPDVKQAAEHTEALHDFAREPNYRLAPTLGISASIRQIIDPLPTDKATSESAQLTLTWTIYDAGVRYADRRTRLAQAESGSLDERQLRRSVATDISVALVQLRTARESFRVAEEAVTNAQKGLDETSILYKQGLARAIELTDANASRYDAEVSRASAKLSMEQAYLNLRYALGLGPVDDSLPNPENPGGSK